MPSLLLVFVADADETFSRAVAVGAQVVTRLVDLRSGQRMGRVRDPLGTNWWLVSGIEDVSEEEMRKRPQDPVYAEAMRVAREMCPTPNSVAEARDEAAHPSTRPAETPRAVRRGCHDVTADVTAGVTAPHPASLPPVDDFDAYVERIRPLVTVQKDVMEHQGQKLFHFPNPNGYVIAVTQKQTW
ncbi:putative enzyme related to lactoylglutathione lyase [Streptomyces glaucescens]